MKARAKNPGHMNSRQPIGKKKGTMGKRGQRMHQDVAEGRSRPDGAIKVRLDARTIITLRNLKMLDFWKQRYPNAEVIK